MTLNGFFLGFQMQRGLAAGAIVILGLLGSPGPLSAQGMTQGTGMSQPRLSVVIPQIDSQRGRRLFVTKGCFICHSVKGVGGKAAPPLDAPEGMHSIDVLGFVARMWKGAPLMFELQSMELGYRIDFSAEELADLAGFTGDSRAQKGFSREEIPEIVQEWMVDKAWWKDPTIDLGDALPKKFPDLEEMEPQQP